MKTTTLKTKAMSILLVLAMCFSMLPMSAFAADEGSTGGVEIATAELPAATVGVAYSVTLSATPEGSTFFWNISGLPDGLTADYSGNITGTPTTAGTYAVSVSVGSTGGGSAAKEMTLTVFAADGDPVQLEAPSFETYYDADFEELYLVYEKVENASKYIANYYMKIDGEYHWIGRQSTSGYPFYGNSEKYCVEIPLLPKGEYYFTMTSVSESSEYLSSEESDYVGPYTISDGEDPFPAPTNLKWDGKVATWDAVDGAARYGIILYHNNEEVASTYSATAQHDFGSKLTIGGKFSFAVQALGNSTSVLSARSGLANENDLGYAVTINNGTGSGRYNAGDSVTIRPNEPATGYRFGWWDGMDGLSFISTNGTTGECVLRMPERDVTMTAYYEKIPTDYYTMTVINGKLDAYGGATEAQILEQTMFSFTANEPDAGYQFKEWTWTGVDTLSFANLTTKNSKMAFISMPSANVTVTAVWEKLPADAPTVTASGDLTLTHKGYTDKQVSVTVTDPKEGYTYSYQWYDASTDQPISGATNAAYTVPNDLAAGSYSYYCVATAKREDNGETSSSQSFDIAVTVNKATLTADDFNFEKPANLVFHYSGNKHATVTPKDGVTGIGEITVQYVKEQGQTVNFAYNAGTYTVKINVAESANYLAAEGLTADGWTFTITKGTQDAPTGLVGVAETIYGKNDGEITGVYDDMEYRKAGETDAEYKPITGEKITGLAAGTYYVRLKETDNLLASPHVTVTIAAGRMLTITVPSAAEQLGYTIEAQTSCAYGATVEIKITALEGYGRDENFDVYNNESPVSSSYNSATGILTLENVTEDVSITLANGSFVDRTKPTAEITLGTNKWNEFWNNLTFGLFFKETQTVTITADDKGSGLDKVYYYISASEMERIDVNHITAWQEYKGAFNIDPDRVAVIYVKAVDKAGNLWLVNSDGLVLDATAPTLEGIENGKTYYGDLTVIIPADQFGDIDQVTLDGETMNFVDGTYGRIPADNAEHTVIATDKAGNETVYKITVYKIYEVTFKHPTFELGFPVNHGATFNEAHPDTVQDMVAAKDYHTFIGWYESTDGGETLMDTPYDFGAKVTGDVTLYPLFKKNTYTVDIEECHYVGCIISGGGSYQHGQTVTLTAAPADGTKFEYWLDTSVQLSDEPTEAELRAAIVSYDKTYTFTATENVSLEAVFSGSDGIDIMAMLIAGTDQKNLLDAEWMDVEYDFGTVTPGAEQIVLPGAIIEDTVTIGDKHYRFAGFITFGYDDATETETAELKKTLTIGKMPLYGSAEYWDWFNSISDGIYAAYMEYTPEEDGDDPQKPSSPQTGDNSNMALWIALLFISGGAVITLTVVDRKRRTVK